MKKHPGPMMLAAMAAAAMGAAALARTPPPGGGTISIEPRTADGEYDPALTAFAEAAGAALTDWGFTILDDPGHAASTLELILSRSDVGTALAKVPKQSKPIIGPGVIVPLPTGKSDVVPVRRVRLEMRFHRRGDPSVAWDGVAVTVREARGPAGNQAIASDLIRALLRSYPAQPKTVIGVP